MRIKNVDMLHGNLFRSIIVYSIPILFMGLVQKLFNAVDIVILRYFADTNAVASVGATTSIIHLLVDTFFGISVGTRVVLSRHLGASERDKAQKTVATSLYTAVLFGVITAIAGFFLAPSFLRLTNCPAECMDDALLYMRIYLLASPAILLYNYGSAILAVSGDTKRPLYYMVISGVLNVSLNVLLCLVLEHKVAAVAIATALSQLVGAILVTVRLFRMEGLCRISFRTMRWSNAAFGSLMANGIPVALSTALYPFSNLQIQTQINSFGAATIAGNAAASNLEGILTTIVASPMISAMTSFVGQNLGAKQPKRAERTIWYCLTVSVGTGLVLSVLLMVFSRPLVSLFAPEEAAIIAAQTRMKYTTLLHFITFAGSCFSRAIQTFGYPTFSTINSVVSVLIFRIIWTELIYVRCPTFEVLCQCFPVSWLLSFLANFVFFMYLYYAKFKKGTLKKLA